MQTDGTNTLSLIVGAVQSNSKETSSDRRYSAAARWRACLLSITCYYVTWASCKCSIFALVDVKQNGIESFHNVTLSGLLTVPYFRLGFSNVIN